MDWSWFAFVVGALAGLLVMWVATIVNTAREAEEFDRRWR